MKKAILAVLAVSFTAAALFAQVHFQDLSFKDAVKQAAKQKKIVMVDYYTSWCGWCKVLDKNTYSDSNVGKYADDNCISLKVDAEHGDGVQLAKSAKLEGYPTVVFYNGKGQEIHRIVGYKEPAQFLAMMETAVSKSR